MFNSYKLLEPESEVSINSNLSHVNNQIVRHFPIGNGKSDLLQQFYVWIKIKILNHFDISNQIISPIPDIKYVKHQERRNFENY